MMNSEECGDSSFAPNMQDMQVNVEASEMKAHGAAAAETP
jgi:hypothetical protein